jgi:hypothetical protein
MLTEQLFPLADYYLGDKRFRLPENGGTISQSLLRAKLTGEFRCPKQDEWYISGAISEAYKTRCDLSSKFWIAKIVLIEKKTIENVVEVIS